MNYDQLEKLLNSLIAYSNLKDEEILNHFKNKFTIVPYNKDYMFIFTHEREFQNKNHIISLHKRNGGYVPMHIFHYIVLTYIYSGTFVITVEDKKITLFEGDIIILDRHVPHSVDPTSENDLAVNIILGDYYFSNRFINKLSNDQLISQFMNELMNHKHSHIHYLFFHTHKDLMLKNCIQNILCEYFEPKVSSDDIIDNYIMILLTHLARMEQYNTNLSVSIFKNQNLLNDIMKYIQNNYKDGNLKNMCSQFGYDPSYTSKLIKKFSGKTFKELVNEERMKKALILLQNKELPIYQIANEIGIQNLTSFYKRFKEYTGFTPQEYRNQNYPSNTSALL